MLIWSSGQKLNEMATSFLVQFQFLLFKKGIGLHLKLGLGVSPIIKDTHICLVSCLVRFPTCLEHTCYYWLIFYFILIFMFFLDSTRGITNISFLVVFPISRSCTPPALLQNVVVVVVAAHYSNEERWLQGLWREGGRFKYFFKKGNFLNRPPPPHTANYHEKDGKKMMNLFEVIRTAILRVEITHTHTQVFFLSKFIFSVVVVVVGGF